MGTLKHNPLNPMFNAAVQTICKRVWPQGFDTSETNAPGTFKALKEEYERRGRITVYSGASDKTIFDDHGINVMLRAWHDHAHLRAGGKSFNPDSEEDALEVQKADIVEVYGMGEQAAEFCAILEAEIMGQALYYDKYKAYVYDQRAFVEHYLEHGREAALGRTW